MTGGGQAISLTDGRRLGYGTLGPDDGHPVMYFHGTPGSRFDARAPGVEELVGERGVRVIAAERPGYGLSDRQPARRVADWADDVRELADALGLERFAVYGWSAGGPHALACAARLGDRVTAVASVCGSSPRDAPGFFDGMGPNERLLHRLVRISPRLVALAYRLARRSAERSPERFFRDFEKDCRGESSPAASRTPGSSRSRGRATC